MNLQDQWKGEPASIVAAYARDVLKHPDRRNPLEVEAALAAVDELQERAEAKRPSIRLRARSSLQRLLGAS